MRILPLTNVEKYVAVWEEYGDVTREQLMFLERYGDAKNQIEDVEHTLEWIEDVKWRATAVEEVPVMFWEPLQERRDYILQQIKELPLRLFSVGKEAIDGYRLLSFRRNQWLSTTAMITTMKVLAEKYTDVGVVSPSFREPKEPDRKRIVANAYKAFTPTKSKLIGALNYDGAHWVAFFIDVGDRVCILFDPLQEDMNYAKIKASIKEVVEPLLPVNTELTYDNYTSCFQQDSDNCGLWCLIVLELSLTGMPWHKGLYQLVPYLRLRFLSLCLGYVEEKR
ncbi:hypothetical protein GN958_ATG21596 [Phytophthora infestans]|uniref:Ubiquitin-like protease family profile domain-containing protein n=1 Tax=Phytophthora infestans TaxID=4787 RepID=A0A8S9TNS1_PHYIN|nr:hypothetical protein GN958_ATG21596 [Phytophthora infestans]